VTLIEGAGLTAKPEVIPGKESASWEIAIDVPQARFWGVISLAKACWPDSRRFRATYWTIHGAAVLTPTVTRGKSYCTQLHPDLTAVLSG
jgi:hypothetical protein